MLVGWVGTGLMCKMGTLLQFKNSGFAQFFRTCEYLKVLKYIQTCLVYVIENI